MEIVPAPDFPTAGIIYGLAGVREGYRTGRGQVVMRAKCHFEDIDRGQRQAIIVDEIPYQVNKKNLLERIAELVNEKKLEGISHIQDESDKSGMRVVIELKRGEVPEVVLNNLYKQTQLQDTFGINMVALIDGQPKLCNLKRPGRDLPRPPARSRDAAHRVRAAQGARARPRARGPGRGAGQHRRVHRDDQDLADAAGGQGALMSKSWDSSMVREMLARVGRRDARRPRSVSARRPARALRPAGRRPVPPVGRTGRRDPADAPAAPHRPGAGQDHRRVQGGDGAQIADLLEHPGDAGARDDDHRRRARGAEAGVRPDQGRRRGAA